MMRRIFLALAIVLASSPASAQQAAGETAVEPQPDPPKRVRNHFGAKLAGGATYRTLFSSSLSGGTIDLGLGAELKPGAIYGNFGVVLGSTKYGLPSQLYTFGPSWEFRFDRVRLGFGMHAGYLQIARVTQPDHPMGSFVGGIQVFLTVDLFVADNHALYLGAKLSGDGLQGNDAPSAFVVGPTLFAGLRF